MKTNMKKIDGDKLRKLISELPKDDAGRKWTMSDVSRKMGYSPEFVSKSATRGTMSTAGINLLSNIFGIEYKDFAPAAEVEAVTKENAPRELVMDEETERIIREIVDDELSRAFMEISIDFNVMEREK